MIPIVLTGLQAILLAGGLGSNPYLYNFLAGKFPETEIIQRPYPGPWQAICRGAVIRADIVAAPGPDLEADWQEAAGSVPTGVISRKSRHSYGIGKFVDFVEGFHDPEDRWEMESVNRVVAINQMEWYIKRVRTKSQSFLFISAKMYCRMTTCKTDSLRGWTGNDTCQTTTRTQQLV
jgi:hypothetical protein